MAYLVSRLLILKPTHHWYYTDYKFGQEGMDLLQAERVVPEHPAPLRCRPGRKQMQLVLQVGVINIELSHPLLEAPERRGGGGGSTHCLLC